MADARSFAEEFKDIVDTAEKENPHLTYLRKLAQNLAIGLRYAETNDPRRLIGLDTFLELIDDVNKVYGAYRDLPVVGSLWTYLFGDRRIEVQEAIKPVKALASHDSGVMTAAKSHLLAAAELSPDRKTLAIIRSVAAILTKGTTKENSYNTLLLLSLLKLIKPEFKEDVELSEPDLENIKLMTLLYLKEIAYNEVKINEQQRILDDINERIEAKQKQLAITKDIVNGLNNKIEVLERDENRRIAYIEQLKKEELRLELNIQDLKQKNTEQEEKLKNLEEKRRREAVRIFVYTEKISKLEIELQSVNANYEETKAKLTQKNQEKEACEIALQLLQEEILDHTIKLDGINLDIEHASKEHLKQCISNELESQEALAKIEETKAALEKIKAEKLAKEKEVATEKEHLQEITKKKEDEQIELDKVQSAYRFAVCEDIEVIKIINSLGPDALKAIEDYSEESLKTFDKEQREKIRRAHYEMQSKATGLLLKSEGRSLKDTTKVSTLEENVRKKNLGYQCALEADARAKEEGTKLKGTISRVVGDSKFNDVLSKKFAAQSTKTVTKPEPDKKQWVKNEKGDYVRAGSEAAKKVETNTQNVPAKPQTTFVSTVETESIAFNKAKDTVGASITGMFAQRVVVEPKAIIVEPPKAGLS